MTRRARNASASSLDLFLDTVCNTFGGIMFIAILLSLMVQNRTRESQLSENQREDSSLEAAVVQVEMEQLRQDREILAESIRKEEARQPTDQKAALEAKAEIASLRATLEQAQSARDEQSERLITVQQKIKELSLEIEDTQASLVAARAELLTKSEEMDAELHGREPALQPPRVRITNKVNAMFLLRYNRVYFAMEPDGTLNPQHVDAKVFALERSLRPLRNAGWDLSRSDGAADLRRAIAAMDNTRNFASIAVWPDSHAAFQDMKRLLIDEEFDYHLHPVEGGDEIHVGAASGAAAVQ